MESSNADKAQRKFVTRDLSKLCTMSQEPGFVFPTDISKNQARKLRIFIEKQTLKKQRRLRERTERKERYGIWPQHLQGISKSERNEKIRQILKAAQGTSQRLCIDLSWDMCMNDKEISHLSDQLKRSYSILRRSLKPLHLYLCNFSKGSRIYNMCCKKHKGFTEYVIDQKEEGVTECFPLNDIVYLSPDSKNELTSLDISKVYIVGGLVDISIQKNRSLAFAQEHNIQTARLPIDSFLKQGNDPTKPFKKVLTIDQVVFAIQSFYENNDWKSALVEAMPKRMGFVEKTDHQQKVPAAEVLSSDSDASIEGSK